MFGIRYLKTTPTTHLMQFRKGALVKEGPGLSTVYFGPTTTMVAVPVASQDCGFMLELTTADHQAVTVQGQVTWRVAQPQRTAALMDFSLAADGKTWRSEDPQRLRDRVVMQAEVVVQQAVQALALGDALTASARVAIEVQRQLAANAEIRALGLEVLGASVVAIRPTPDIARALEAKAREASLRGADEAIYERRMAAVEHERSIRQNELDTEVAVEIKKREIQASQLDAKAQRLARENELRGAQMGADIELEERRKALVQSQAQNTRALAEAEAHRVASVMAALEKSDPRIVQALAAVGMQPGQLIAQAFGGIAERAERIGQLNMSPELLQSLIGRSEAPVAIASPAAAKAAREARPS
jgi:SPFH domain / Band 7 family